jgi:hypothetical protein
LKQTWASRLLVGLLGLGLLLFFVAVIAISGRVALAQDAGATGISGERARAPTVSDSGVTTSTFGTFLAGSVGELASLGSSPAPSELADERRFRLRLVHSVRFPLTEQRCYFQFFVDAAGSAPLEGAALALEMIEDGRVIGRHRVEVAGIGGQGLSRRIREFAFDGPCALDALRLTAATRAVRPAGVNYTAPVDLLESNSISTSSFRPLRVLVGADAPLSGAADAGFVEATDRLAPAPATSLASTASNASPASPSSSNLTQASASGTGSDLGAETVSRTVESSATGVQRNALTVQRQLSLSQLERACVTTRSNLRAGPGTDFGVRTVLDQRELLYIQRRTADGRWNQIVTSDQVGGWIYFSLIRGC